MPILDIILYILDIGPIFSKEVYKDAKPYSSDHESRNN